MASMSPQPQLPRSPPIQYKAPHVVVIEDQTDNQINELESLKAEMESSSNSKPGPNFKTHIKSRTPETMMQLIGAKCLVFVSPRSVKMRELERTCSVCILFEESVFIFQFFKDRTYNYVNQNIIVDLIIQKLKNKHTFLKTYTN